MTVFDRHVITGPGGCGQCVREECHISRKDADVFV